MALTNSQYDTIIKGFEAKQNRNRKLLEERTAYVYSHVAGYQELDALWFFISLNTGYSILPLTSSQIMLCLDTPNPFSLELDKTASSLEALVPSFTVIVGCW